MLSEKSRLRHWKLEREELLYSTPIYRAYRETYSHPDLPETIPFYTIHPRDGVNIIACDRDSLRHPEARILWVRQFRPAVRKCTLELPGGGVEADDPDLLKNAQRELLEEGAAYASRWIYLGKTQSNAALNRNHLHSFLALGVKALESPPQGDGREVFEVEWRPFKDRFQGILTEETLHSSTLKALSLLEAHLQGDSEISKRM